MKIFNTIEELWSYCSLCPICRAERELSIEVGPDDVFINTKFNKQGSILTINCRYRPERFEDDRQGVAVKYFTTFYIDCDKNTYQVATVGQEGYDPDIIDQSLREYFYFYVHATCKKCISSHLDTNDLEFDKDNKTISNIEVELETVYLISEPDSFSVTLRHDDNRMMVAPIHLSQNAKIERSGKAIRLPLVNMSFSDVPKAINKIKTLILFS